MTERKSAPAKSYAWVWWLLGTVGCLFAAVVVAFVAMAYNNFLTFNCRAAQSEAKVNLSGLFTAEKAFFYEHDESGYSTDLNSVGWWPDGAPRYVVGFAQPSTVAEAELAAKIPGYDPARMATDHPDVIGSPPRFTIVKARGVTRAQLPASAIVTSDGFLAAAAGNIDDDATVDVWTVDQDKNLVNVVNDCVQ